MLSLYCRRTQTLSFVFICSAEDLFTLTSNKFKIVYIVDRNPQLDSRDWSMYSNNLKSFEKLLVWGGGGAPRTTIASPHPFILQTCVFTHNLNENHSLI